MSDLAKGYYATPDPNNPDQMTYWRVRGGRLTKWPTKAAWGPILRRSDVPKELVGEDRNAWIRAWVEANATQWYDAIRAALAADPIGCALRFAELTTRCLNCGRKLTDPASKVYGIGPECRDGLSAATLAALAERVGQAHAAARGGTT